MEFPDLPFGLSGFLVRFCEVFVIFHDLEDAGKLIANGISRFDPSNNTFIVYPHIIVAVFYEFLGNIALPLEGAAKDNDLRIFVLDFFGKGIHMTGVDMIRIRDMEGVELGMGAGVNEIRLLLPGHHIIVELFELLDIELTLLWDN